MKPPTQAQERSDQEAEVHSLAGIVDQAMNTPQGAQVLRGLYTAGHSICVLDGLANLIYSHGPSVSTETTTAACQKARSALYWQGFSEASSSTMSSYSDIADLFKQPFQSQEFLPSLQSSILATCDDDLMGALGISSDRIGEDVPHKGPHKGGGIDQTMHALNDALKQNLHAFQKVVHDETCKKYVKKYLRPI